MSIRRVGLEGGIVGHVNLVDTVLAQLGGLAFDAGAAQDGANLVTQLIGQFAGRAGYLKAHLAVSSISHFCNDPNTFCHGS